MKIKNIESIFPTRDEVLQNRRDNSRPIILRDLNDIYFTIKSLLDKKIEKDSK